MLSFLRVRTFLSPLLAALCLLAAGSANAAVVVGKWDPAFGAPFGNLGWRGEIKLDVPVGCTVLSDGSYTNDGGDCSLITVLDSKVEFYALSDPMMTTVETLDFTTHVGIDTFNVDSGEVDGFTGLEIGYVTSTSLIAMTGGEQASFGLSFNFTAGLTTASLSWFTDCDSGSNDAANFPAKLTVTTVPEPTSLALALLALGALPLVRRRG